MQEELDRLSSIKSDDPFIDGLRDLQENLDRVNSIKIDDPFIEGLRDLQEEHTRLVSIKSDEPFIAGLRDLQENLALLRSIKIEEEGMHSVTIDQAAYPPKKPHQARPHTDCFARDSGWFVFGNLPCVFCFICTEAEGNTFRISYLT